MDYTALPDLAFLNVRYPIGQFNEGQHWAYRENAHAPLQHVTITAVHPAKRNSQITIEFPYSDQPTQTVPHTQAVARWEDAEKYQTIQDRWDTILHASRSVTPTQHRAMDQILTVIDVDAHLWSRYGTATGVLFIENTTHARKLIGPKRYATITADPAAHLDGPVWIVPWRSAKKAIKHLARTHRDVILEAVDDDERQARLRATTGRGDIPGWICAQADAEIGQPARQTVRRWCRQDPPNNQTIRDQIARELLTAASDAAQAARSAAPDQAAHSDELWAERGRWAAAVVRSSQTVPPNR